MKPENAAVKRKKYKQFSKLLGQNNTAVNLFVKVTK